jgi:hypothetical protein
LHSSETRKWSHDIRNGMNALRLCTSALEVCAERKDKLELLSDIDRAADQIASLTERMPRDLSDPDEGN